MRPIKALIFDLDGTMIGSMDNHLRAWSVFAKKHNIRLQDNFLQRVSGKKEQDIISQLWSEPLTELQAEQLNAEKDWLYNNLNTPQPIAGIVEFISKASELKIPSGIGSGASRAGVLTALKQIKLPQQPYIIVSADDGLASKPSPATFLAVAQYLQIEVSSCLVFEDSSAGLQAAFAANMPAIAVCHNADSKTLKLGHILQQIDDYQQLLKINFLEKITNV